MNDRVDFAALPRVASPANYGQSEDRRLHFLQALDTWEHPWAFFHSCNLIYLKQTALAVDGYDEIFDGCWGYEDVDFAHRMITRGGAQPVYLQGINCYHQDSELSNRQNRFDKENNRNWRIITQRIPGFASFKIQQYAAANSWGAFIPGSSSYIVHSPTTSPADPNAKCGTNRGYVVTVSQQYNLINYIFSVTLTAKSCFPINVS